jgi:hexosaminidase
MAFRTVGTATPGVSERDPGNIAKDVTFEDLGTLRARYLRVRIQRYGKLPAWHAGAGEEAWFFVDEIVIFP